MSTKAKAAPEPRTDCPICGKRAVLRKSGKMANHYNGCAGGGLTIPQAKQVVDDSKAKADADIDAAISAVVNAEQAAAATGQAIKPTVGTSAMRAARKSRQRGNVRLVTNNDRPAPAAPARSDGLNLKKMGDLLSLRDRLGTATDEQLDEWLAACTARLEAAKGTSAASIKLQDQLKELIDEIKVVRAA